MLTPTEIRLILACMGIGGSTIRPGEFTGLMRLDLVAKLNKMMESE